MPRDSTDTRNRLIAEAERLFASRGIHQVTNREIIEAAGQRNVSALTYHFGSRDDLLGRILVRHGAVLDAERGRLAADLDETSASHDLVRALVEPYAGHVATQSGRDYLRIVDQLRGRLADWRTGAASGDVHLQRLLELVVTRPEGVGAELREQRLLAMMMLLTAAVAERARLIDEGRPLVPDHQVFVANLTDMLVGITHAPSVVAA